MENMTPSNKSLQLTFVAFFPFQITEHQDYANKSCYEHINVFITKKTATSDSGTEVCGSLHQPPSDTRQPAEQNFPSPPQFLRPNHQKNAETFTIKSQFKRKRLEEDIKDMGGPELKRKMTDQKNASRKISYQHERSHHDQNKCHYSTGPSCATSGYLGKPDRQASL